MTDQIHVPDEWLLAAAIDAHNDGREALADFDGDDLEYLSDGIAAVIPLVRAEQAAEIEQLRAQVAQVRHLAEQARSSLAVLCMCPSCEDDESEGCGTPPRPISWNLNPADVLDATKELR